MVRATIESRSKQSKQTKRAILIFSMQEVPQGVFPKPTTQELTVSSFRLHKNGLTPLGKPTFEEWQACGAFIQEAEQSVQFWIGDWLNFGEKTWGTKYAEAIGINLRKAQHHP